MRLLLCNPFKLECKDLKCQTATERHMVVYKKVFEFTDHNEETETKNLDICWPISMIFGSYESKFNK